MITASQVISGLCALIAFAIVLFCDGRRKTRERKHIDDLFAYMSKLIDETKPHEPEEKVEQPVTNTNDIPTASV